MKTEVLTQTDPMLTFEYGNIKIETFWNGGANVSFKMSINGKEIASGNDFRPTPLHNIDDIFTMVTLIGFMTLQPGDTDPEYFSDHTQEHLEFLKSNDCDLLRVNADDYEDKNSKYHKQAVKFFKKHIKNLV